LLDIENRWLKRKACAPFAQHPVFYKTKIFVI